MIRYKLYQYKNESNEKAYGKWYARAVADETYDTEQLAEHMADHNTPYSIGIIRGVLSDMISCIQELLLDGKKVKLDGLAYFYVGLTSQGVEDPDEFSSSCISKVSMRARGTGNLTSATLTRDAVKKAMEEYYITDTVNVSPDDDDSDDTANDAE